MGKIVVIGSTNTDMVVKSERFPAPGETILGGDFFMFPGGKGANQAVAAARLGGDITFLTRVGDDVFGNKAITGFEKEGIDTSCIIIDDQYPSGVALINVNQQGENQIVVASGANAQLMPNDIDRVQEVLARCEVILVQLEIPLVTVQHIIATAKELGKRVILNPAPAQALPEGLLSELYCLTPNQSEAELLTGVQVIDEASALKAGTSLLDKGVDHVIVTMGAAGALFISKSSSFHVSAQVVAAVDTTAAGDVYNGALSVAIAEGRGWKEAMELASHAASLSVTKMGAQSSAPYRKELHGFAL